MTSPFVDDTVELGARVVRGALSGERIFRDRLNPLAFSEEYFAIHKVAHALTGLAESFVVFPGTCPTQTIKEGFYNMAGIDMVSQGAWLYRLYPYTDLCVSGRYEGDYVNRKSFHSLNIQ
ncbi:hypothetical protein F7725_010589, partial [Dissostichus mawsoni]